MNCKIRWFLWGMAKATVPFWRGLLGITILSVILFGPGWIAAMIGASQDTQCLVVLIWPMAPIALAACGGILYGTYRGIVTMISRGKKECLAHREAQ